MGFNHICFAVYLYMFFETHGDKSERHKFGFHGLFMLTATKLKYRGRG